MWRKRMTGSDGSASRTALAIDACSRRLVPRLLQQGYVVQYVEFAGGHHVPAEVRERAAAEFLNMP